MCGIVGYIGDRQAQPILLACLRKLEYRGYDSCGIAVAGRELKVYKDAVRVKALEQSAPRCEGRVGVGHTRWATHGEPSCVNAHPHCDCTGQIAVVHNGIITNYDALRKKLAKEGHKLASETDTEVIPHLIEKHFQGNLAEAVSAALKEVEGSYAIIAMRYGEAELVAARRDSPLIIGIGDRENFIASDVPAVLDHTSRVVYLDDGETARVTADSVEVRKGDKPVQWREEQVEWDMEDARKSGYEHFMLKEIHEQPRVIRDTLREYMSTGQDEGNGIRDLQDVLMLACGTSYHAALVGKYIIERLSRQPVRVEIASEFNYSGRTSARNRAIVLSQSGETADVLKAVRRLRGENCRVTAITNVVGSSVSRLADEVIYTRAGPEISVAATKSFTAQLIALYWLALPHAIGPREDLILALRRLPVKVQGVLDNESAVADCAKHLSRCENVFFIGRGLNYPIALEGALKLKEVSYIHAEGFAAGELKHGPFALLGAKSPVVAIVANDQTREAMLTNVKEIKARRSPVLAIVEEGDDAVADLADWVVTVPQVDPLFTPVVNTVALQLLAYHVAALRGCPIDFPRNLAKSVTVE